MSEKVKIRVYASTNRVGSKNETTIEIDAEEYAGMSEEAIEETCREVMFEMIEWGYEVEA